MLRKTRNRPLFFWFFLFFSTASYGLWYWINNILLLSVPKSPLPYNSTSHSNPFPFPKTKSPIIPCCSTPTFDQDLLAPHPIKTPLSLQLPFPSPISAWMVVIDIPLHKQNARFPFFSMRGNTHSKLIQIGKQRNIIVGRLRTRAFVLLRGH